MAPELEKALMQFAQKNGFINEKGPLSVAIIITAKHGKKKSLPLNPEDLLTSRGGQVSGLSGKTLKDILSKHGISRVLASEGGRTSRGSLDNMKQYVAFLNDWHDKLGFNLDEIEAFWVDRVRDYFASQPFVLKFDRTNSMTVVIKDLLSQAKERQKEYSGTQVLGAVMQHLVGAKLELIVENQKILHNNASTADFQLGRPGDFLVGDVAIHVTSAPSEALIGKCANNLESSYYPIIFTLSDKVSAAKVLAENKGIEHRIDVFALEEFMASNIYELGKFNFRERKHAIEDIILVYNRIVDQVETDPGLKISLGG